MSDDENDLGHLTHEYAHPYERPSPGLHDAVCVDWWWSRAINRWERREQRYVTLKYQLAQRAKASGSRIQVTKRFTPSLDPRSSLSKWMHAWKGKPLTDDERLHAGLVLETWVGVPCQLTVTHITRPTGTWVDLTAISPWEMGCGRRALLPEAVLRRGPALRLSRPMPSGVAHVL